MQICSAPLLNIFSPSTALWLFFFFISSPQVTDVGVQNVCVFFLCITSYFDTTAGGSYKK